MTTDDVADPVDARASALRRPWWKRRWVWAMTAVVVVVIAFVLYWFQPQKLLIDEHANEEVPRGNLVELARGEFISLEHGTSGTVRVLQLEDGSRIVRLDDLNTSNGPTLYVYLSANPANGEEDEFDDEYVDLGGLEGNIGSQNYELPATVDLSRTSTIVIWCDRFDAAFGAADLVPV